MDRLRDPFVSIVLVILIGILCGFLAQKLLRRSWIAERLSGGMGNLVTHMLVGVAGAFVGFHIAMLATASTAHVLVPFIVAAVLSGIILWGWRSLRG